MSKEDKLIWRLKEKPTAEGVALLVQMGVITKDEAREILFSEAKYMSEEEIQALKEQIKFYKGLLTKALENQSTKIVYTYDYRTPPRYWRDTTAWMSASGLHVSSSTGNSWSKASGAPGSNVISNVNTLSVN